LFLNTIRAIIIADSKCLQDYMMDLTELLISHTSVDSQQIRNIVAEILGRLLADFPEEILDTVEEGLKSNKNQ
jgi:cullin-associated NEDD8-dissociated protein 1